MSLCGLGLGANGDHALQSIDSCLDISLSTPFCGSGVTTTSSSHSLIGGVGKQKIFFASLPDKRVFYSTT